MITDEIVLIDLSSLAHPIWHVSASEPDPNHTSQQIVARVRELSSEHVHAAVCCDSGKSFRNEIDPTYKANRPESEAPLHHQIKLARDVLAKDGFPIWKVRGFEADDVIATAATMALAADPDIKVMIVSADKDLLQLVGPRVRALSPATGTRYDAETVKAKFGVEPEQMRDYLSLVGDKSDNIQGAKGIGKVTAAKLLAQWGTLDKLYAALEASGNQPAFGLTPSVATSLREFRASLDNTRTLITLRTDVDVPFAEIAGERTPPQPEPVSQPITAGFEEEEPMELDVAQEAGPEPVIEQPETKPVAVPVGVVQPVVKAETGMAVRQPPVIDAVPVEYERQLDPRSLGQAETLATRMYESRMFSGYGSPQAVFSAILVGRELGMPAMASLRGIHVVEGKHTLSAQTMVALVLKSGLAEYFEPIEVTPTTVTYETHRKGNRNPMRLTHTIEMATQAGLVKPNSNWVKVPSDMLVARCSSRLCRLIYPDICGGLYTPDELKEVAEDRKAKVA